MTRLKVFIFLFFFLPTLSFAGELDRVFLSLTPSLSGGMMGIKSMPSSPLAYNGPSVGTDLRFSVHKKTVDFFVDAAYSFGWLGNAYHRDPKSMFNNMLDLSIGGMGGIYTNDIVSLKAGCAIGGLGEIYINRLLYCSLHAFAFDARMCLSAEMKLPGRFSIMIEDRIPFVAFISSFNKSDVFPFHPDHSWKAFPGNALEVGICRTIKDGRSLMLAMRHYCYSSGRTLPNSFQLQFLELSLAFRFGLTKLYDNDL